MAKFQDVFLADLTNTDTHFVIVPTPDMVTANMFAVDSGLSSAGRIHYIQLSPDSNRHWSETYNGTGPTQRQFSGTVYDPVNNILLMYGGIYGGSVLSDTWELNLGTDTWTQTSSDDGPGALWFTQMWFDIDRQAVMMFGGSRDLTGTTISDKLWIRDNTTNPHSWVEVTTFLSNLSPGAVHSGAVSSSSFDSTAILLGGVRLDGMLNEIWKIGTIIDESVVKATWTNEYKRPEARQRAPACSQGSHMMIYGGTDLYETSFQIVKGLDDAVFTEPRSFQLDTTGTSPGPRWGGAFLLTGNGDLILTGGGHPRGTHGACDAAEGSGDYCIQSYIFDPAIKEWSSAGGIGVGIESPAGTYFSTRSAALQYGGAVPGFGPTNKLYEWAGSPPSWADATPSGTTPDPRNNLMMAYHIGGDYAIMCGGFYNDPPTQLDKNYKLTYSSGAYHWTDLNTDTLSKRSDAAVAWDPVNGTLLMFGGRQYDDVQEAWINLSDTCYWDGEDNAWAPASYSHSPSARYGCSIGNDGTYLYLYGGTNGAVNYDDLWRWTGTDWQEVAKHDPVYGHSQAYDPASTKFVVFGGRTTGDAAHTNTFTINADFVIKQKTPATTPGSRSFGKISENTMRTSLILHGGFDMDDVAIHDTWEWADSNWTAVVCSDVPSGPAPRVLWYNDISMCMNTLGTNGSNWSIVELLLPLPETLDAEYPGAKNYSFIVIGGPVFPGIHGFFYDSYYRQPGESIISQFGYASVSIDGIDFGGPATTVGSLDPYRNSGDGFTLTEPYNQPRLRILRSGGGSSSWVQKAELFVADEITYAKDFALMTVATSLGGNNIYYLAGTNILSTQIVTDALACYASNYGSWRAKFDEILYSSGAIFRMTMLESKFNSESLIGHSSPYRLNVPGVPYPDFTFVEIYYSVWD